jgi:carotenoid cleavage dioxygenase-like enzyme
MPQRAKAQLMHAKVNGNCGEKAPEFTHKFRISGRFPPPFTGYNRRNSPGFLKNSNAAQSRP